MNPVRSLLESVHGSPSAQAPASRLDLSGSVVSFDAALASWLQELDASTPAADAPRPSTSGKPEPVDIAQRIKSLIIRLKEAEGRVSDEELLQFLRRQHPSISRSDASFRPASTGASDTNSRSAPAAADAEKKARPKRTPPSTPPLESDSRAAGRNYTNVRREAAAQVSEADVRIADAPPSSAPVSAPDGNEIDGQSRTDTLVESGAKQSTRSQDRPRRSLISVRRGATNSTGESSTDRDTTSRATGTTSRPQTAGSASTSKTADGVETGRSPDPKSENDSHPSRLSTRQGNFGKAASPRSDANHARTAGGPQRKRSPALTNTTGKQTSEPKSGPGAGPPSSPASGSHTSTDQPRELPRSSRRTGTPAPMDETPRRARRRVGRPNRGADSKPVDAGFRDLSPRTGRTQTVSRETARADTSARSGIRPDSDSDAVDENNGRPRNRSAVSDENTKTSEHTRTRRPEHSRGTFRRTSTDHHGEESRISMRAAGHHDGGSSGTRGEDSRAGGDRRHSSEQSMKRQAGRSTGHSSAGAPSSDVEIEFSANGTQTSDSETSNKPVSPGETTRRSGSGAKHTTTGRPSARPGESFASAAWRRAIHNGRPRSYRMENGWHVLTMELDAEESQLTVKTRPGEEKISVSVGMNDPKLRSVLAANADRLQATLRAEYEADIDFSLSGDEEQSAANADTNQSSDRGNGSRGGPGITEQTTDEETPSRDRHSLYGSFEWIG